MHPYKIKLKTQNYFKAYRELIRLGLPILVGQLGLIVVGFADNIMVGNYSTEALASASFVNNMFNVAIFCCLGFSYGLTPLAGALFGAGNFRKIGTVTRTALWINILYTLMVTALMTVVYFNVHRLGQPEELLPLIKPYFVLYLCGMVPVTIFGVLSQWSYAINNTALPMWIGLGTNAINIVGNYMLIYGHWGAPELGLYGAGISTLVARVAAPVVLMAVFFFRKSFKDYKDGFLHGRRAGGDIRHVVRTSLPVSMQMTFESGSFTVAAIMAGWIGTQSLAAFQIIVIVGTLGFCIYYSLGSAIAVKVSNAAGASDSHRMRHVAWAGYHIMLVLMTLSSLVFIIGGRHLMQIFTSDPAVAALAASLIVPLVLYQLGDATQITFASALRGTSRVMPMLWIAFFSYVMVGIPVTYLLAFPGDLGLWGIILSFSASLFVAGALFLTFFLRATKTR